ncbi:uncharacterized protein CANTADRAFT_26019 [Suhomyces tanzawaensis NRRL Y-17324]|uniref:Uncharacterized protein n=1 Tax=Suhomyces tanzawaensis NRRL Y-17324 TaxID=984487 RepID=A0A1E4SHB6_9ASCO|nr:uncharacterized protein CANTADRAFT_26019 [Suhomyces tanzawaensis NRRL Y-17324]ODV78886.1 hypothetical protein CANTADRAFT_26019 [Suhomyces tanzawaensis NRRL Y-17324]
MGFLPRDFPATPQPGSDSPRTYKYKFKSSLQLHLYNDTILQLQGGGAARSPPSHSDTRSSTS